jgi:hypothetical protein
MKLKWQNTLHFPHLFEKQLGELGFSENSDGKY